MPPTPQDPHVRPDRTSPPGVSCEQSTFDWEDARRRLRQLAEALAPSRHNSVDRARQILDQRARALAVPLPAEADETEAIELLRFQMGGQQYALEAAYVLELARVGSVTQVPGCPNFVRGITNLRGDVLAIIDLCTLFHGDGARAAAEAAEQPWMLVLGDERAELGIVIDEAEDVCSLNTRDIFPTSLALPAVQRDVLRGVTEQALLVLDGAAILADPRLVIEDT